MVTVIEDASAPSRRWAQHGLAVRAHWVTAPSRDDVRAALRELDEDGVLVCGTVATLNIVVDGLRRSDSLGTPIGFLPSIPASGSHTHEVNATLEFAERFALPQGIEATLAAEPVSLTLARNDIGGVLLGECIFERPKLAKFGAQTYHDDTMIADGLVRGLSVRPEYGEALRLRASITPASGRKRSTTSYGRAVQTASDPVPMWVDGRDMGEVTGRTWYVDDREHWLLRGARREAPTGPERRGFFGRMRRR
ncbi:MAG: hypothetical protein ACK5MR_15210 [Cumulibacter sp.]